MKPFLFKFKGMAAKALEPGGYPSGDEFDENLYQKIMEMVLPSGQIMEINWFRTNVWEDAAKFSVPKEGVIRGMQANMFSIRLESEDGSEVRCLMAKRIIPGELPPKKNPEMWKGFVESVQREIDFYTHLNSTPNRKEIQGLFPKVYHSSGTPIETDDDIMSQGYFFLLMEDLSPKFYQSVEIQCYHAYAIMDNLAKFHAFFWNKMTPQDPRGSFWVLERRKPMREIEDALTSWADLIERFEQFQYCIPDGESLMADFVPYAQRLDDYVGRHLWTRIHGDCKGYNLFLTRDEASAQVIFIDMQWTGKGHPLQDVAYVLTTTLQPDELINMDHYVDYYCTKLESYLPQPAWDAIEKDFRPSYDLFWLDYARMITTGLWRKFSPELIERYKNVIGPSMITRSLDHARFIISRIHRLLRVDQILKQLD